MKNKRGFFSAARRAIAIMLVAVFCFANLPTEAFAETQWGQKAYDSNVLFRAGDETVIINAANLWECWGDEIPEISYAWHRDAGYVGNEEENPEWELIEGETGGELEVPATLGRYRCVLSDENGTEEEIVFYVTEDTDYNDDNDVGNDFVDPDGNDEEISVGEEKTVTAAAGEPNCFTFEFTPDVSGDYLFYSSSDGGIDAIGRVLIWDEESAEYTEVVNDDDSGDELQFSMSFSGTAGTTYYLQARTYSIENEDITFKVYVAEDTDYNDDDDDGERNEFVDPDGSEEEIVVGEEKNVTAPAGEPNCFTFEFTPDVSGDYFFYSSSEGDVDAYGRVLIWDGENEEYTEVVRDDDSGDELHFFMSFTGTAGTTYYLQARTYSIENEDITFNVALDENKVESIAFYPVDPSDTERFECYQGVPGRSYIYSDGSNFWMPGDKIVVTENGEEVTYTYRYEYDEDEDIEYQGFYDSEGAKPRYGGIKIGWDDEEWSLGENEVFITYCGKSTPQTVTLKENPVISISYTSAKSKEYTTVEMKKYQYTDYDDDDYCYDLAPYDGDRLTVNTDKGEIVFEWDDDAWEWDRISGDGYKSLRPDSGLTHKRANIITAGTYDFIYEAFGKEATVSVNVVQASAIEESRFNALKDLRDYYNSFDEDDYYDSQRYRLERVYDDAAYDIDDASTVQEINATLGKAKADMDAILNKTQYDAYADSIVKIEFIPTNTVSNDRLIVYSDQYYDPFYELDFPVLYTNDGLCSWLKDVRPQREGEGYGGSAWNGEGIRWPYDNQMYDMFVEGDRFVVTVDSEVITYTYYPKYSEFRDENGLRPILGAPEFEYQVGDDTVFLTYGEKSTSVFTVKPNPVRNATLIQKEVYQYNSVELLDYIPNDFVAFLPFAYGDKLVLATDDGNVEYMYDGESLVRQSDSVESTLPSVIPINGYNDCGGRLGIWCEYLPFGEHVAVGNFYGQIIRATLELVPPNEEETELYETREESLNALWTVYNEIEEAIGKGKYRAAQKLEIDKIYDDGLDNIYEAYRQKSKSGMTAAANAAIAALRGVKTDAQLTAEEKTADEAAKKKAAEEAAKKKAAEEAAKKKAAEEAAKKKAAEELKEWNGVVNKKIPVVKSPKYKTAKKSITVSWTKASKKNLKKFDTIEVQICTNKKFAKADTKRVTVKKSKKKTVIKRLKKGKTYYVRVRNVKGKGVNKKVSKWSKVKKIKVK